MRRIKQNLLIFCSPCIQNAYHFFTNSVIVCLKNGNFLYHVYLSLPMPCTPIIINCQMPSIGTIYGWPEISLHLMNSPIIASFKFSITSPFPNHSFSSDHITSSPISFPKQQFQLRPHHIQSHLHSQTTVSTQAASHVVPFPFQTTVSTQATSHPVPSPFPNHSFN